MGSTRATELKGYFLKDLTNRISKWQMRKRGKKGLLSEVGFEPTPSYEDQNALDYL